MPLQRYCLEVHPFKDILRKPLQWSPDAKANLFAEVDGFSVARPGLSAWFEKHFRDDGPNYFVLQGLRGSGRSSVAGYIVHLYGQTLLKKYNGQGWRVLKVECEVASERKPEVLRDWLDKLDQALENFSLKVDDESHKKLSETISMSAEQLPDGPAVYRRIVKSISTSLSEQKWRMCALLDQVKNPDLIDFCRNVFLCNAVVIFEQGWQTDATGNRLTAAGGSFSHESTWPEETAGMQIKFDALTGKEAVALLNHCWQKAHASSPQPFDEDYIKFYFDQNPKSIELTIQTLRFFFDRKLETLQPNGNSRWPQDTSLRIDANDFARLLADLGALPAGWGR